MDNNILQENAGTEQVEEEEGVRTKKAISFLQTRCSLLMKTLPKSEEVLILDYYKVYRSIIRVAVRGDLCYLLIVSLNTLNKFILYKVTYDL